MEATPVSRAFMRVKCLASVSFPTVLSVIAMYKELSYSCVCLHIKFSILHNDVITMRTSRSALPAWKLELSEGQLKSKKELLEAKRRNSVQVQMKQRKHEPKGAEQRSKQVVLPTLATADAW